MLGHSGGVPGLRQKHDPAGRLALRFSWRVCSQFLLQLYRNGWMGGLQKLITVAGAGAGRRRVPRGLCRPAIGGRQPSSTSASTSCLSHPVLPRRLWRVVGWVGILSDVIGGVESALWEGCYPALTLASTCGANRAS
jgi:hypothetical protein